MANWKSVLVWGNVEEIHDHALRLVAVKKLNERTFPARVSNTVRLSAEWPYDPADVSEIKGVFLRVFIHTKSGRFEKANDPAQPNS
ncbi:MAG: hypothetical protein H7Y27_09710 [Gemmatimonadaceae bacterium]|nr:hypothetical protein [Chitinophagaceae bacterium]